MTVVLGMLCVGGLIMGADSEEAASMKRSVRKLPAFVKNDECTLIAGGAGATSSVEGIASILQRSFLEVPAGDLRQLEDRFQADIHDFYTKHVLTWPTERERLEYDFSLIIGISFPGEEGISHRLWAAEKGVLRPIRDHYAVGIGGDYANVLLDDSLGPHDLVPGGILAIGVLAKVKRDIANCGKQTHIWCLRGGKSPWHWFGAQVNKAEFLMTELEDLKIQQFNSVVAGDQQYGSDATLSDIEKELRKKFAKLRKDFEDYSF